MERIASSIIGRLLGDFVKGFDSQLKFSLSGELELNNLELKENVLDFLDHPLTVKSGLIQKVYIKIPWYSLSKSESIIQIQGIHILASPKHLHEFTVSELEKRDMEVKKKRLEYFQSYIDEKTIQQVEEKLQSSFTERFSATLFKSLRVGIQDIHIRIEDKFSQTSDIISCGFYIERITGINTNKEWEPKFNPDDENIYKKLTIEGFNFYICENDKPLYYKSLEEFGSLMKRLMLENRMKDSLILANNTSTLYYTRQKQSKQNIEIVFDELDFIVSSPQYRYLMEFFKRSNSFRKNRRFRKFYPDGPLDTKKRWKFLIDCALSVAKENRTQCSLQALDSRIERKAEYIRLYHKKQLEILTAEEAKSLDNIVRDSSIDELLFFRSLAELQMKKSKQSGIKGNQNTWTGWVTGFFVSPSITYDTDTTTNFSDLSEEERKMLYRSVGYNPESGLQSIEGLTTVKTAVKINFNSPSITLLDEKKLELGRLCLHKLSTFIEVSDSQSTFNFDLWSLEIVDNNSLSGHRKLLYPQIPEEKLIGVKLCTNPDSPPVDYHLIVNARKLNILLDPITLKKYKSFFGYTSESVPKVRSFNQNYLRSTVKKSLYLAVDIEAPNVIVPLDTENDHNLIFSLGHTSIHTDLSQLNRGNAHCELYEMKLSDLEIYTKMLKADKTYETKSIIHRFDWSLSLKSQKTNQSESRNIMITSTLPELSITLSHKNLEVIHAYTYGMMNLIPMQSIKSKPQLSEALLSIYDEENKKNENINISTKFILNKLTINFVNDNQHIMAVNVLGLGSTFSYEDNKITSSFMMRGLSVKDPSRKYVGEPIIESENQSDIVKKSLLDEDQFEDPKNLVSVFFRYSPFDAHLSSYFDIKLNNLTVRLEKNFIKNVVDFFSFKRDPEAQVVSRSSSKLIKKSTGTRIDMNFKMIKFIFIKERPLFDIQIKGSKSHICLEESKWQFKGYLGSLDIYDLTNHSQYYTHIVSIVGDKIVEFSFNLANENNLNMKATVYSIKVLYFHKVFTVMKYYIQDFLMLWTHTSEVNLKSSIQTDFNITLQNPLIIVPQDTSSKDCIQLDLGQINIQLLDNDISYNIRKLNAKTGYLINPDISALIIRQENFIVDSDIVINQRFDTTTEVAVGIDSLVLQMDFKQLSLITHLLRDNIYYTPNQYEIYIYQRNLNKCEGVESLEKHNQSNFVVNIRNFDILLDSLVDDEKVPLIKFGLGASTLNYSGFSNMTVSSQFQSSDLRIEDVRPGTDPVLSNILNPIVGEKISIQGTYELLEDGQSNFEVNFGEMKQTVVPKFVNLFYENAIPIYNLCKDAWDKRYAVISMKMDEYHKAIQTKMTQQGKGLQITINVPHNEFSILSSIGSTCTLSTRHTLNYNFIGDTHVVNMSFEDLEVYTDPSELEGNFSILSPSNIKLSYLYTPNSTSYNIMLVNDISVVFSLTDVILINNILKQFKEDRNLEEPLTEESYMQLSTLSPLFKDLPNLDDDMNILEDFQWVDPVDKSNSLKHENLVLEKVPLSREEKLFVSDFSIEIVLLDDLVSQNLPTVKNLIKTKSLSIKNWTSKDYMDGVIEIYLESYHFNQNFKAWEPLVEPSDVEISFSNREVRLRSQSEINLNVSKSFMETVRVSSKLLFEELTENKKHVRKKQAPFILKNYSGMELIYTIGEERKVLSPSDEHDLNLDENKPFIQEGERVNRILENVHNVGCVIPIQCGHTTEKFDLASISTSVLRFGHLHVLCNVTTDYASKIITFLSSTTIRNATTFDMDILIEDEPKHILHRLKPEESYPFPLTLSKTSTVLFKPVIEGHCFGWSVESLSISEIAKKSIKHEFISSGTPSLWCVTAIRRWEMIPNTRLEQFVVELNPPLIFKNLLCNTIEYELLTMDKTKISDGTIERRSSRHIYEIPKNQNLYLKMRMDNFLWSDTKLIVLQDHVKLVNTETISMNDYYDQVLKISVNNALNPFAIRTLEFISPFWIVNKSGFPLRIYHDQNMVKRFKTIPGNYFTYYKEDMTGDLRDQFFTDYIDSDPQCYSAEGASIGKLWIGLSNTNVSAISNLKAQNSNEPLVLKSFNSDRLYEFSVTISQLPFRTRVITLCPKNILINKSDRILYIRQANSLEQFTLLPNERVPWHWPDSNSDKLINVGYMGKSLIWSGDVDLKFTDIVPLRIYNPDKEMYEILRTEIKRHTSKNIFSVKFTNEENLVPMYLIENHTSATLHVRETRHKTSFLQTVQPKSRYRWGWHQQRTDYDIDIRFQNSPNFYTFSFKRLKAYPTIVFRHKQGCIFLQVMTTTENTSRLIVIKPVANEVGYDYISRMDELNPNDLKIACIFDIKSIGISLIDDTPTELVFAAIKNLYLEMSMYKDKWACEIELGDVQIDNQLTSTYFPVLLYSYARSPKYFMRASLIQSYALKNINYIPFFSISVRESFIQMDQDIVTHLLQFIGITKATFDGISLKEDTFNVLELNEQEDAYSKMIYTHVFHINPSKFNFSYIGGDDRESQELVKAILKLPKEIISAVDRAPIKLAGILIEHSFHSQSDLISKIYEHYKSEITRQTLAILGSYEVLGNPTSLLSSIGEGVTDLFHDPSEGGTTSPQEFSRNISSGESFARKTFYGLFNSASSVTKGVGSGISYVSMDSEYRKSRIEMKRRKKPTDVLQGLEFGVKEFGSGVLEGISGIIEQPIKGLESEGVEGMFKGIAKGLLGFVVKPTVGVIDMVQRTTEGIKNTANVNNEPDRTRLPRYIPFGSHIQVYDEEKAKLQYLLHTIDDFKYTKSHFWDDQNVILLNKNSAEVKLLISSTHLIFTRYSDNSFLSIEWKQITFIRCKEYTNQKVIEIGAHNMKVDIKKMESYSTDNLYERLHDCWNYFKAIERVQKKNL